MLKWRQSIGANYYIDLSQSMSGLEHWLLPPLTDQLQQVLTQLQGIAKGGLQDEKEGDKQQVKGLKFISNRLIKLFERNRKLKYSHISKILIDNFASESNDSRNIKRRVYDAINVMVAAGLFSKSGDMLEKKESSTYRESVQTLKAQLYRDHAHRKGAVNNKKLLAARLAKRKKNLEEIITRNRSRQKEDQGLQKISNPSFVCPRDGAKIVHLESQGQQLCRFQLARSGKGRSKGNAETQILKDSQYLQHL